MSTGPDWSAVGASLGRDFHIARLTFKNHVGCGHTFQAIDGALELQRLNGFTHAQIERLHVATYKPALDIACYTQPTTANAEATTNGVSHGPGISASSEQQAPIRDSP